MEVVVNNQRRQDWMLFLLVMLLLVALPSMVVLPAIAQDGVTNLTGLHLAVPTYCATGTPGLLVNNTGVNNAVEFQDNATPFYRFEDGGNVVHTVPTALATSVPGMVINHYGLGEALEIQNRATPEYYFDGSKFDLLGNYIEADIGTEHIMFPSVVTKAITYTAAAGGTGTVAIVAAGETWIVHSVLANVTTDFACTGNDTTLDVGDASDADGFLDLADAELQKADTEGTGFSAGWQGMAAGTIGAYLDDSDSGFVVAATTLPITITYLIDETSGETITTGAATLWVVYTRVL